MSPDPVTFGPFTLDTARRTLTRDGAAVELGQRGCALLQALLRAQGEPVTKTALMDQGWPGSVVEEGNLTVQIAQLRKLLGTDTEGRDWIVTVPRLGYRLVMPSPPPPEIRDTPKPALAVMPFANLSGDVAQDYFADGVVEDIITALSKFKSFAVIARNSSFTYKGQAVDVRQIGHELGVRYVLEGSIRRAADRLRISAQLVECEGGKHIWAEQFDGAVNEVFDFQDRITESVATVVEPLIQQAEIDHSRRNRPGSIAAYDLYLRALPKSQLATDTGNAAAVAMMTEALVLEPDNAVYLATAASWISDRTIMGWPPLGPDDRQRCASYVARALSNASQNATVLTHCGNVLLHFLKDYDWAITTIQSAVQANPNDHWTVIHAGVMNLHCGSITDALNWFHRAIRLSPRDPFAFVSLTGISHAHLMLGDLDEALVWATRSLTLNPNYPCTYWMLLAANSLLGRMDEAQRHLAQFQAIVPGVTIARIRDGQPDRHPERIAPMLEGMRLAGLPES
jgi:TolB-like protein